MMKRLSLILLCSALSACATYETSTQDKKSTNNEKIAASSPNTSRTKVTPKPTQDNCNDSCSRFGELSQSENTVPEVCNCKTKED